MNYCCKVEQLIDRYDLADSVVSGDIEEYMLGRWHGRNEYPETGVRPLTDWFNQKILKSVYGANGRKTLKSTVDKEYEVLTEDEGEEKMALMADLEADGIDAESLVDSFISTATLYRHFTNCLEAEKSSSPSESGWETDKVDFMKSNVENAAGESLRSLENKGEIPNATSAEIDARVVLGCPHCDTQVSFQRAVNRGYVCRDHMSDVDEAAENIEAA